MVGENVDRDMIGGSSPHQPFHESSFHGPRTGPNMVAAEDPGADVLEGARRPLVVDAGRAAVLTAVHFLEGARGKNQPKISSPRTPRGCCKSWRGPALNPSSETANAATRTRLMREL